MHVYKLTHIKQPELRSEPKDDLALQQAKERIVVRFAAESCAMDSVQELELRLTLTSQQLSDVEAASTQKQLELQKQIEVC